MMRNVSSVLALLEDYNKKYAPKNIREISWTTKKIVTGLYLNVSQGNIFWWRGSI
jgi:hypothetical protein